MSNTPELLAYNPDLIGNHMRALAEVEQRHPFDNVSAECIDEEPLLYDAGVLVARACLAVRDGNRRTSVRLLEEAHDKTQELASEERSFDTLVPYRQLTGQIAVYKEWAKPFVRKSAREAAVTEARRELCAQTIEDLGRYAILSRQERETIKSGTITELTVIGLLERQQHPWHFTTMALPHHDQGYKTHLNFDTLTSVSMPDKPVEFYKVQCKTGCFGTCSHVYSGLSETQVTVRNYVRQRIARTDETVKEISGCCDLDLWNRNKVDGYKNPRQQLLAERKTIGKSRKLDAISNGLLLEIGQPTRITPFNVALPVDSRTQRTIDARIERKRQLAQAEEQRATARQAMARIAHARNK
jgi:hypothetical protein